MDDSQRWSEERASAWYGAQPWLLGSNFVPSTASNQLEMWQAETFDPETIRRELGWAAALGMNTMRVFLHDLPWAAEADAFAGRIDAFLGIASDCGIRPLFVLFDDCWHDGAALGPQPPPVPGRHNSRWLQSPGYGAIANDGEWPRLEAYVRGIVGRFAHDERVLGWDIYNEVTNGFLPAQSLPAGEREAALAEAERVRVATRDRHLRLLELAFEWARSARPSQPLTAGAYSRDREMNALLFDLSDVVSFHCYEGPGALTALIARLRTHGRPLLCTEYMARTEGSGFHDCLPVLQREGVAAYNWGFVNGRTQTHIAWRPLPEPGAWFHDVLHADGTPYDAAETALIRRLAGAK
jgi:hypothetical protein